MHTIDHKGLMLVLFLLRKSKFKTLVWEFDNSGSVYMTITSLLVGMFNTLSDITIYVLMITEAVYIALITFIDIQTFYIHSFWSGNNSLPT